MQISTHAPNTIFQYIENDLWNIILICKIIYKVDWKLQNESGTTNADKVKHKYNVDWAHDTADMETHQENITAFNEGKKLERGRLEKIEKGKKSFV